MYYIILCFQPEKVKFELKLGQSKPIYNAFKAIKESSDWEKLSDARKRIVECECYTVCKFFNVDCFLGILFLTVSKFLFFIVIYFISMHTF